jgi:hypothetical protein
VRSDDHATNGRADARKNPDPGHGAAPNGTEISAGAAANGGGIEYYILCPQRATEVPGLITHLISRDICEKRQSENYHKCPNCVRSRIWRERNGLPVEEPAVAR